MSECKSCGCDQDAVKQIIAELQNEKIESKTLRHGLRLATDRCVDMEAKNARLLVELQAAQQSIQIAGLARVTIN